MQHALSAPSSSFASTAEHDDAPAPRTSRRPPVLTMTSARASLFADSPRRSRYSSLSGSRFSSRRRPELPERYMSAESGERCAYANANANAYGARGKPASTASASEWFSESGSASDSAESPMRRRRPRMRCARWLWRRRTVLRLPLRATSHGFGR
ncbi:hypothetical protein FB451DRAFT_1254934 [Mycena latifolia]|nr:hypothetical protein FB451DRAFT_1254934 [Mycena latifolia]